MRSELRITTELLNELGWLSVNNKKARLICQKLTDKSYTLFIAKSIKTINEPTSIIERERSFEVSALLEEAEMRTPDFGYGLLVLGIGEKAGWWHSKLNTPGSNFPSLDQITCIDDKGIHYIFPNREEPESNFNQDWHCYKWTIEGLGSYKAFKSIQNTTVAIIGCGRIGSELVVDLAKSGMTKKMILVDPKQVEEGNLSFTKSAVGLPRVAALKNELRKLDYDHLEIATAKESILEINPIKAQIWISAVNSREVREVVRAKAKQVHAILLEIDSNSIDSTKVGLYAPPNYDFPEMFGPEPLCLKNTLDKTRFIAFTKMVGAKVLNMLECFFMEVSEEDGTGNYEKSLLSCPYIGTVSVVYGPLIIS